MSWITVATLADLPSNTGVAALIDGFQVAIFHTGDSLFALDNYCPFARANVLARGIIGDLGGNICVASPIYKQHYSLTTGQCFEDKNVILNRYAIRLQGNAIELKMKPLNALKAA